jgi:hypothetical protein
MHRTILLACAALAVVVSVSAQAAAPGTPPPDDATITFEQYRDWRLNYTERRRSELAVQLSAADLPEQRKARLQETKAYFDWLAGLPEADRDRRFRERFNRIDANHDGKIDTAERAAWRDKQRAFYHRKSSPEQPRAAAVH